MRWGGRHLAHGLWVGWMFAAFGLGMAWTRTWGLTAAPVDWARERRGALAALALGALGGAVYSALLGRSPARGALARARAGAAGGAAVGLAGMGAQALRGGWHGGLAPWEDAAIVALAGAMGASIAALRPVRGWPPDDPSAT